MTPKNSIVRQINDYMLDLIPCEAKMYLSYDSSLSTNLNGDAIDVVHTPEFLNTINTPGLPNHKLRLKVGVPVMLLRNIDQRSGLCNGTRLIITRMGKLVPEGKVIFRSNICKKFFYTKFIFTPSDVMIPFKFQRRQFPIVVSFAMTINKSQGQSLKKVEIYCQVMCFHMVTYILQYQELPPEMD